MIFLDTTTRSLEFLLGGTITTNQLPFTSHYADLNSSFAVSDVESNNGVSNNITAVTLVAAPGASTFRQVKFFTIFNADTVNATVTIRYNDNATTRVIKKTTLEPDWTLEYSDLTGIKVVDENGSIQESIAGIIPLASGGTAAALTAVNGGLIYSTATALAISAAGLSGQIPRSGGAGAPTWSTATYPATATTTGAYLRADGTNWITSTLVLPNAATVNRVPYATGANAWGESANFTFNGTILAVSGFGVHAFDAGGTGGQWITVRNTTAGTGNYAAVRVQADSSGAGIDQTTFSSTFTSTALNVANGSSFDAFGSGGLSIIASHSSGVVRFGAGGTTLRAQINANGTQTWAPYGAGTATFDASGNITSVSDERDKDILGPFTPGLRALSGLRSILHRWNAASGLDTENIYASFSAQNVLQFIPEAVGRNTAGKYSLNIVPIVAATVTAMQELTTEIDELRAAVNLPIKSRGMTPIVDGSRIIVSPTPSVKA